jgi:transcriptional regulator NrdR family protein
LPTNAAASEAAATRRVTRDGGAGGRRVAFDRHKVARSTRISKGKHGIGEDAIERLVNGIVRQIEATGEGEIPSTGIGELAMQGLAALDEIAYVRFASVYRGFATAKELEELIRRLAERAAADPKSSLWQRELIVSSVKLAEVAEAADKPGAAPLSRLPKFPPHVYAIGG